MEVSYYLKPWHKRHINKGVLKELKYIDLLSYDIKSDSKKYHLILVDRRTMHTFKIAIGDKRYEHYYDSLGQYSDLNHFDIERRDRFYARFNNTLKKGDIDSPAVYNAIFLW